MDRWRAGNRFGPPQTWCAPGLTTLLVSLDARSGAKTTSWVSYRRFMQGCSQQHGLHMSSILWAVPYSILLSNLPTAS